MADRNPKYDGLQVFKIDVAKLRSGDVLLTRNVETTSSKGRLKADVIMKATGGNFSHALLCTVPPTFIEAIGHGVSNLTALRCFVHDLKNVRLLRYHDPLIAMRAASEALPLIGKKYSVKKAVCSILPSAKLADLPDDEIFCSALVAAAFRKVGAEELKRVDPMKVTPATLEKATFLSDITDQVFIQILSPSNIEEMTALDGDRVDSPLDPQAALFQEFCAQLLPMIHDFIDNTPVLTFQKTPTTFLEAVLFIGAASAACNGLPNNVAEPAKAKLQAIDNLAFSFLNDSRYQEMRKAATANDDEGLQYTVEQSFLADPDIDMHDTRSTIASTREQIEHRSRIFAHSEMNTSRTTTKWLEIQSEVVDCQKRRLAVLEEIFRRVFPGEPL